MSTEGPQPDWIKTKERIFKAAIAADRRGVIQRIIRRNAKLEFCWEQQLARPGEFTRSLDLIEADFTRRRSEDLFTHYNLAVRRSVFPLHGEAIDEDALQFAIRRIAFHDLASRRHYARSIAQLLWQRLFHRFTAR